jgi:hypothetical protein
MAQPAAQQHAPAAGYAGSDTCEVCHSDKAESLKGTPHSQAKNPRTPAATHGCESCHGPGQAHVDDDAKGHIRKFGQIKPAEMNETCLACHSCSEHAAWKAVRTTGGTCRAYLPQRPQRVDRAAAVKAMRPGSA